MAQTCRTRGGATLQILTQPPTNALCNYCNSPVSDTWETRNYDLCGHCLMDLKPDYQASRRIETAGDAWWLWPKAWVGKGGSKSGISCDGCGCDGSRAHIGMFTPHQDRCLSCSRYQSSKGWRPYKAPSAQQAQAAAADSKAVLKGLGKIAGATLLAGSAALTGAQLANLMQQSAADGVITGQEASRMVFEAAGGQADNLAEIVKAAVTHDPAPFLEEVVNNGESSGLLETVFDSVLSFFTS